MSLALTAAAELFFRTLPDRSGIKRDEGELKYRFNPYRPDPVLSYALREHASAVHHERDFQVVVHTNALGLRGEPMSREKAAGAYRILVIGDPFAFGFGVEDDEGLPPRLASELSLARPGVEVLNAGVPVWSADDYYLFLETRGFELEPDLVLLVLTENDPGGSLLEGPRAGRREPAHAHPVGATRDRPSRTDAADKWNKRRSLRPTMRKL